MLEELVKRASTVLRRIFYLAAQLRRSAPDKDHFVLGRRQCPFGIAWGHVFAGQICGLMAGVAAHAVDSVAVFAALYVLQMHVAVVALQRSVASRVAILAARRSQNFIDLKESLA